MANGMPNAVWVSHTAVVVPARSRSGKTVIVLSNHGIVQWAPLTYISSSGISATCSGTASSATVPMKSRWRCLNSIHAKAYAANAAISDRDDRGRQGDGERVGERQAHAARRPCWSAPPGSCEAELVEVAGEHRPPAAVALHVLAAERVDEQSERRDQPDHDEQPQHPRGDAAQEPVRPRRWRWPVRAAGSEDAWSAVTVSSWPAACGGC